MADHKTIFGETIDPMAEVEVLYLQLINILNRDPRFEAALEKGTLTDEACAAIASAFDTVFERNRRLADIFLTDKAAREALTRFWFARSYAEVQASAAFQAAFHACPVNTHSR